ncbi:MAG: hydrogenase expression/formation protein [Deltaproteobacteria bacterium HGW-Deltaproteobacteria-13]|jgi:hydrogenase maturation protease|nr:MAG: hydrogenase expression/formation protein [Deltaproteobacteria bacterium HGW-Deltaproteobacteria-13]
MSERNLVTILGIGNILLADEGFGVHFVNWFSKRYRPTDDVRMIDGGTLGYALLDIICSCDNLIVVDVLKAKDTPGSIYRFNKEEMELHMPPPTTAHEVTFSDVLFKTELMGESPETIFLCIVPKEYGDMNLEMTPPIRDKFPVMEKLLLRELDQLNVKLEKI